MMTAEAAAVTLVAVVSKGRLLGGIIGLRSLILGWMGTMGTMKTRSEDDVQKSIIIALFANLYDVAGICS
jgi:Ca2+/Na+ antiporter